MGRVLYEGHLGPHSLEDYVLEAFWPFWNPKMTLSIFEVLAKTWLKSRNKTDTRHDESCNFFRFIIKIPFIVLPGLAKYRH